MADHGFNDPMGQSPAEKVSPEYQFTSKHTILGLNSAFTNLFEVSLIPTSDSPELSDFPIRNIKGIKIDNFAFALKKDLLTRKNKIGADVLTYYGDVSIDWMEDDEFSVFNFHNKWKGYYYNEANQTWVVNVDNKLLNLKVKVLSSSPNLLSPQGGTSYKTNQLIIELRNISLPKKLPTLDLQYSKADEIGYSLSYPVEKINSSLKLETTLRTNEGFKRKHE